MKLFKKVAAAVLAGVMALSMVACAPTTPVTPEKPVDPTKAIEDQIFEKANEKLKTYFALYSTATDKYVAPTLTNELKAEAQNVLELIASGTRTYDTADGSIVSYEVDALPIAYDIYVAGGGDVDTVDVDTPIRINATNNDLECTDEQVAEMVNDLIDSRSSYVLYTTDKDTSDGKVATHYFKAKNKIGVASKVINGQTCVVVVYQAD